jgi:hypothetical protein
LRSTGKDVTWCYREGAVLKTHLHKTITLHILTQHTHTFTHTSFLQALCMGLSTQNNSDGNYMIHAGLLILWWLQLDGHTPQMWETTNTYKILVSANFATWPIGKPITRWKDSIIMDVTDYEDGHWVDWVQVKIKIYGNEQAKESNFFVTWVEQIESWIR